jgi:hypothetical protein
MEAVQHKPASVPDGGGYTFQIDIGTRPDGSRERQRFTFPTHDPAVTLRVCSHVYDDALAAAGDALLGRSRTDEDR